MSYSGAYVGTIVSMPLSGWLCDSTYGWPSVFYLCGALGVFWFVLWICLVHSDPRTHPRMSAAELQYITGSLASERVGADASSGSGTTTPLLKEAPGSAVSRPGADPTPWGDIFTSAPVWAIVVGHFCNNWGFYNLLTCLPSYLSNVLNLDITHAGFLAGLPYLCMFLWGNIWAGIVDKLRADGCGSTVFWRKFSQSIGHLIGAAALVVCGYAPSAEHGGQTWCAQPPRSLRLAQLAQAMASRRQRVHRSDSVRAVARAVVCLCIAVGASGFNLSGFNVNHLDIAPKSDPPVSSSLGICLMVAGEVFCAAGRYAGVLMGITNTVATIPGFAAPQITDMIATANHTTVEGRAQLQDQWCAASRPCPPLRSARPQSAWRGGWASANVGLGGCAGRRCFSSRRGSTSSASWSTPSSLRAPSNRGPRTTLCSRHPTTDLNARRVRPTEPCQEPTAARLRRTRGRGRHV